MLRKFNNKGDNMTELECFAKQTLEQGGEWWKLEEGLYVCKTKQLINNYFYDTPVYQVFNPEGKRLFTSTSYRLAYIYWENNVKKEVII